MAKPAEKSATARRPLLVELAFYPVVAVVTVLVEYVVLNLSHANLRIPLRLGGDATSVFSAVKGMLENGWVWVNPHLGAPGSLNTLDFPGADLLHLLMLKALSVCGNAALTVNLYYLLTYPLVALAAAWVLRRLGISRPAALAASVLYAFLPYHLYRSETHLFLSGYFAVPLLAYAAIALLGPKPPLLKPSGREDLAWDFKSRESWLFAAICFFGASTGVYYAVFGAFFILVAGVYGWWHSRARARMLAALALIGVMILAVVVNVAPNLWYRTSAPANAGAIERSSTGAELYSLRPALMVLPVRDHRIGLLAKVHESYVNGLKGISATMDNESDSVTLGIVGTLGFLFLLLALLFGSRDGRAPAKGSELIRVLAVFTLAALLLAGSGMFCTILGVVFTLIRAYNRIVVFVAFFAFIVVAHGIDTLGRKFPSPNRTLALSGIAAVVLLVGLFDQTTPKSLPDYSADTAALTQLRGFVGQLEAKLPADAEVFQLPYVPYPESPPVFAMQDYDHFRPYLVSTRIHWSYGAVKGREAANWDAAAAQLPAGQLVPTLAEKGFRGVWVDRAGYADGGSQVLQDLAKATGTTPEVSPDGRYAFVLLGK